MMMMIVSQDSTSLAQARALPHTTSLVPPTGTHRNDPPKRKQHHWFSADFVSNQQVNAFVNSNLAYRSAQALTLGIPASAILAGKLSELSLGKASPTNFDPARHGLNPAANKQGGRPTVKAGTEVLSTYSSDFSKMVQNFWRLTTVLPTDVLRWGFRGFSQVYVQPLLELVRLNARSLIGPAIQHTILPTYHGKSIEDSRELYPHLTDGQHYALAKEMKGKHLAQLTGLFNIFTESAAGTEYEHLPRALDAVPVHVQDAKGQWVKTTVRQAYPALSEHLSLLANPDGLMADRSTIAKYGVDHFPIMQMYKRKNGKVQNIPKVNIQAKIYNGPVGAFRHIKAVGIDGFMPNFYSHLELAAHGQFTQGGKGSTRVDHAAANQSLSIGMDFPKERANRATHALVEYITNFMALSDSEAKKTHNPWIPGLPRMQDELQRNYKLKLAKQKEPFSQDSILLREMFSNLSAEEIMLGFDRKRSLKSTFDPADRLGLRKNGKSPHTLAKDIAPIMDNLNAIVRESTELANNKAVTATEYQAKHVELLKKFEFERLRLGLVFPGQNGSNYASLANVMGGYGKNSAMYDTTQWMLRSRNAMQYRAPLLKKSVVLPQVLVNAVLGFGFLSLVWNALDVKQIQPYEYNVTQKKGDVKGSGALMVASIIPGASLFTGLMSNGVLRSVTKNSPLKRFVVSSAVGVATATALAYELVHGAMQRKPDNAKARRVNLKANLEIFHHNHSEIKEAIEEHQRTHHPGGHSATSR